MIDGRGIEKASYEALKRSMLEIPQDVENAIKKAYSQETNAAKKIYEPFFEYIERRRRGGKPICPDSGTIHFYISIGNDANLHSKLDFWRALARATERLTKEGILAPKALDPITRHNPNTNVGENHPMLEYKMVPGVDHVEITAVPKGGGGEISGSKFRMMVPADSLLGVKKFVIDNAVGGSKGGMICPPAIFGVGIGGSAAIAVKLAMEAAVLRPAGSRNPVGKIAELEDELMKWINETGVGPAGMGGNVTALDVHIEFSYGHGAILAVGFVSQCILVHRATVKAYSDGSLEHITHPEYWFLRPWENPEVEL